MIEINEGKTNNYLIHGLVTVVTSIFIFYLSSVFSESLVIVAFIVFVIAISLFIATNGLEIDIDKRMFRKFGKISVVRFGKWNKLLDIDRIELRMQSSNAQKNVMTGVVPALNSKSITYDIVVYDTFDDEQIIYDFLDYPKAKEAFKLILEKIDAPARNRVAEKMANNKANRRR
tara:strand:+ start:16080 stop:16601 length:522 start_codon:yes stop_codon:yes gene_type:complete